MRKTQYFQVEFKNVEVKEEGGSIFVEGFASTPDIDSYNDIVRPSAFQNTMGTYMQKPFILLQHNMDKIIGKAVDYRIEEKGLWIRVELFNDIDGTFKNIQEGLLGAFSIGFRALKWEISRNDENELIREITELKLVEVSVVAFPANENARFSLTKSIKSFFDGLEKLKSLSTGAYEVKNADLEITNFEEEMKEDEVKEVGEEEQTDKMPITDEESETEVKEEEEVIIEETNDIPEEVVLKEEEKEEATIENETKQDDIETEGETPSEDIAEEVKSDEVKALEGEIDTLKGIIEAKDVEIKELNESTNELKKTLSNKEDEIKSYLTVAPENDIEKKSSVVNSLGTLRYPEFN